ncbi:hypothetical protein M501DRAFT_1012943 [Patellaria atrata CBS 101060]|uniref:Polyketide synthase-like phosphopantetheine-binding domain-containing protein n=1 Tax=Patellaria atrata CBS 101060 TaxID=1346257 RepID=A0A9P4VVI5_9PEZI|nr:hypothetical protein M501DRAFT_1012943 [Patellaria atrata CBS 101060]
MVLQSINKCSKDAAIDSEFWANSIPIETRDIHESETAIRLQAEGLAFQQGPVNRDLGEGTEKDPSIQYLDADRPPGRRTRSEPTHHRDRGPAPPRRGNQQRRQLWPLFTAADAGDAGNPGKAADDDANKDIQGFFLLRETGADHETLLASCVDVVNARFTKMLRLSEPMEPAKALTTYELDSLSAVEFRNWLRVTLGTEFSTLDVANTHSFARK